MINKLLPYFIYRRFWGDRKKYGLIFDNEDSEWKIWTQKAYTDFYQNTQQKGMGNLICCMEHQVISRVDFSQKKVLEVGPGIIRHLEYIKNKPAVYVLCDIEHNLIEDAGRQLSNAGIKYKTVLKPERKIIKLPFHNNSIDIVISFNSLEHLYPLDGYLEEMKRILCPDGLLVGGIPCEGGLSWGIGRFLTTRRYVHQNYGINYDKIICWEHPNFADYILERLNFHFEREYLKLHPFSMLSMDFNLVASFIYRKI